MPKPPVGGDLPKGLYFITEDIVGERGLYAARRGHCATVNVDFYGVFLVYGVPEGPLPYTFVDGDDNPFPIRVLQRIGTHTEAFEKKPVHFIFERRGESFATKKVRCIKLYSAEEEYRAGEDECDLPEPEKCIYPKVVEFSTRKLLRELGLTRQQLIEKVRAREAEDCDFVFCRSESDDPMGTWREVLPEECAATDSDE